MPIPHTEYDVFLSFRGADTRKGYTNHLRKALEDADIKTFYDADDCETGEPLKQELENAIKTSRASVIVLSENYATSTWCLDELLLILEQNKKTSHIVIPIFYHVNATHLRNLQLESSFKVAMEGHEMKMNEERDVGKKNEWRRKIQLWKEALAEVPGLIGKDAKGWVETELNKEIIAIILHKLSIRIGFDQKALEGLDDEVESISSWLTDASSNTADILTIYGMDGIGKTRLAQFVYLRYCLLFERNCFITDINEKLPHLQNHMFSVISKPSSVPEDGDPDYTSMIQKVLEDKKVLLVLDNVESLNQLNSLIGNKCFHPGSKIIITTKNVSLTENCALFKTQVRPSHKKCLLKGLNETASKQLLCFHAFMDNSPAEGFEELCEKLVKYCQGHPKALKDLGEYLCGKEEDYWKDCIDLWENKEIYRPLREFLVKTFNSLESEDSKELFKHISHFFAGKDRVFAETILGKCEISVKAGIKNLTDRCLLTIGPMNELIMHQLLQVLGRHEVRQESHIPSKRSRLWRYTDSYNVLRQKTDKTKLLGMVFDQKVFEKRNSHKEDKYDLSQMNNLMLLQLNFVQPNWSYEDFPGELRWLCMHGFPLESIPTDLPMKNLVALDLSHSKIKVFYMNERRLPDKTPQLAESPLLPSLKILNLSFCYELSSLRGFLELPELERLILACCRSLTEISESIGHCHGIVIIDLSYCSMLKTLPSNVFKLKKLTALSLDGCNLYDFPIEINDKEILGLVNANMIDIGSQVSPSDNPESLPRDIRPFSITLPSSLHGENNLYNESFPMAFSTLSMSEKLILDGNPIIFLLNCVSSLRRVELLSLEEHNMLETIKHTSFAPRNLKFCRWKLLRMIKDYPGMSLIPIALSIYLFAHSLIEMEGIVKIQPIAQVKERVIHTLGWNGLDFIRDQVVETWHDNLTQNRSHVQLFYEFGIFSTYYGGKEIPSWINDHKSRESSISFTLSNTNNLRGLNFCYLQTGQDKFDGVNLLTVIVSNITKKRTWIYKPYIHWVKVDKECLVWLSHWMFGKNEMEAGSEVTITIPEDDVGIRECRVSLVYDDVGEQDPLGYYKSWDHIIGRDLSAFRLTTGEYFLDNHRFYLWHIDCPIHRPFLATGACYEEKGVYFRKESPQIVAQSVAEPEHEESLLGMDGAEDMDVEPNHSSL